MPADVYQIVSAPDKHFRAATAHDRAFSVRLCLIKVAGVDDDRIAINLHLGFGKFQSHQLCAAVGEALSPSQDSCPIGPRLRTIVDRNCLLRN